MGHVLQNLNVWGTESLVPSIILRGMQTCAFWGQFHIMYISGNCKNKIELASFFFQHSVSSIWKVLNIACRFPLQ